MRIAILGGGGGMGGIFGGYLARAGNEVTLVDVSKPAVNAINTEGLAIEEKDGSKPVIKVPASDDPSAIRPVDLARAQGIALDYDERWSAIAGLLEKAVGGKASMLQDVEAQGQTEIDVINGAIVEAGRRTGVPTPHSETMVWMIQAAERHYVQVKTQ